MKRACAAAIVLAFACGPLVLGQAVTSTIVGNATDSSGAVVPNAQIKITEQDTGISRSTKTDSVGEYTAPHLTPGSYRIDVESQRMKKVTRTDLVLHAGSTVRVDVARPASSHDALS